MGFDKATGEPMPVVHLADRATIGVSGADAEHFLQNLITTDLAKVEAGTLRAGALLTPQGKVMFDFLVSRDGDGFRLDCRRELAADLERRLMLYRLRAKVELSRQDEALVAVSWEDGSSMAKTGEGWLVDTRFSEASVFRHYGGMGETDGAIADWDALRVRHGVAESGADYAAGDAFPHDILLDQNGGVGLRKGCYVGQEVVSRMHHRGTARRRVLVAEAAAPLPPSGTEIAAGGRAIGTLGTVAGSSGLAIARIDRVKTAMDRGVPILAGAIGLTLSIPPGATFTFPDDAAEADQG